MNRLSIRAKLVLIVLAVALPILVTNTVITVVRTITNAEADMKVRAQALTALTSSYTVFDLMFINRNEAQKTLAKLSTVPEVNYAALYDKDAKLFAEYRSLPPGLAPTFSASPQAYVAQGYMQVFAPVMYENEQLGTLLLLMETTSLNEQTRRRIWEAILGLWLAVIVALVLIFFLQRLVSGPILDLARLTQRISQDADYSVRIPNTRQDEIGILNDSFNRLLEKIDTTTVSKDRLEESDANLRIQNARLKKANEELDLFVYSASHDLRAPIASAQGLNQLAKAEPDVAKIGGYLALQEKTLARLEQFIRDIIDYSRNNRTDILHNHIDFNRLLRDVFEQAAYEEQYARVEQRVHIDQGYPFFTDRNRLQIILNNLVVNAIRFSDPAKAQPSVSLTITTSAEKAVILVADNGLGIEAEQQAKLFRMFHRAHSTKSGSGLGLYIVKEALDRLQGRIEVQSQPGKGTTFRVEVPNMRNKPTMAQRMAQDHGRL